jgi:hypothetical protein
VDVSLGPARILVCSGKLVPRGQGELVEIPQFGSYLEGGREVVQVLQDGEGFGPGIPCGGQVAGRMVGIAELS